MLSIYNKKNIERVCKGCGVDKDEAVRLLARYEGKPERVLTEHFGAERLYIEPVSVRDPLADLKSRGERIMAFCAKAKLTARQDVRCLFKVPLIPALMIGLIAAPAAVTVLLMAALAGVRFGVECDEENCDMA